MQMELGRFERSNQSVVRAPMDPEAEAEEERYEASLAVTAALSACKFRQESLELLFLTSKLGEGGGGKLCLERSAMT